MARREILTCDRCKHETLGLFGVDLGNDYSIPKDAGGNKTRVHRELCQVCLEAVRRFASSIFDTFGRPIDNCGQVICAANDCEVRINHEYSDGTPRPHCAEHEWIEREDAPGTTPCHKCGAPSSKAIPSDGKYKFFCAECVKVAAP